MNYCAYLLTAYLDSMDDILKKFVKGDEKALDELFKLRDNLASDLDYELNADA